MMRHTRDFTALSAVQKRARGRAAAGRRVESLIRQDSIRKLAQAIYDTHPQDAREILTAALDDLTRHDGCADDRGKLAEDARWWSGRATFWQSMPSLRSLVLKLTGARHE